MDEILRLEKEKTQRLKDLAKEHEARQAQATGLEKPSKDKKSKKSAERQRSRSRDRKDLKKEKKKRKKESDRKEKTGESCEATC